MNDDWFRFSFHEEYGEFPFHKTYNIGNDGVLSNADVKQLAKIMIEWMDKLQPKKEEIEEDFLKEEEFEV